mgnify:CR=1 FL=1
MPEGQVQSQSQGQQGGQVPVPQVPQVQQPVTGSYQQYQQMRFQQQQEQAKLAQQAILSAGADSFTQKVMDAVNALRSVSRDLVSAQKQLEAQMFAQQRQLQLMQQHIDQVVGQLQTNFRVGGSGGAPGAGGSYMQ